MFKRGATCAAVVFSAVMCAYPAAAQQLGLATPRTLRSAPAAPTVRTFLDRQLEYPRVRNAYAARSERVDSLFRAKGLAQPAGIYFRVFKREQVLEVWARSEESPRFVLINTYPVCRISGRLGPKRREGDRQIPEGFYAIDLLNPWSNFHLSMRVNYPNAVDRATSPYERLGGDIYIHGGCATIGCVPVTDEWIEEIYVMVVKARQAGQEKVPVHIFPTRLDHRGMRMLNRTYGPEFIDAEFWRNLQEGYAAFERTHTLPIVEMEDGRYTFIPTVVPRLVGSDPETPAPVRVSAQRSR